MREFLRHPAAIPIEFRHVGDDPRHGTRVLNVSHGGLCFRAEARVDEERILLLSVPSLQPGFEVRARVAWCLPIDRGEGEREAWDVGVAFLDAQDAWRTRLVEQACHIEAYRRELAQSEGRVLDSEQAAREWVERFAADFPKF
jgi:hypothetical protein